MSAATWSSPSTRRRSSTTSDGMRIKPTESSSRSRRHSWSCSCRSSNCLRTHPTSTRAICAWQEEVHHEEVLLRATARPRSMSLLIDPRVMTNTRTAMQRRLLLIGLLALASVAATVTAAAAPRPRTTRSHATANGSRTRTVPGDSLSRRGSRWKRRVHRSARARTDARRQQRERADPEGRSRNVCPAFSPDGTMLAFGTRSPAGLSLSVVRMTRAGRRAHLEVRKGASSALPAVVRG